MPRGYRNPDIPNCPETGLSCSTAYHHRKCRCDVCRSWISGYGEAQRRARGVEPRSSRAPLCPEIGVSAEGAYSKHGCRCGTCKGWWRYLGPFVGARTRARKYGVPFEFQGPEDLPPIPTFCPALGIRLEPNYAENHGGSYDTSPSLDRIVPEDGYTKTNTVWISNRAN